MVKLVSTAERKEQMVGGKSEAQRVIARANSMESSALNFKYRWQECSNYIQPRKGNIMTILSPGAPQTILLWDTTAEQSLLVYAAGLVSFLTPTGERWFRYESRNKQASPELKAWFDTCSELVALAIANSEFYETWHEDCMDGGAFGSSLMRVDEHRDDPENLLGFSNIPVGTFYWDENHRGRVDTVCRRWEWTAEQACQEFGEEALTEQLLKAYKSTDANKYSRKFKFIEMTRPNDKAKIYPGATPDVSARPWISVYVAVEDEAVIFRDGYYENPYAACRTMRSNNEIYGRGPGTQAMPEIKMVNRMEEDLCVVVERMAKPSWISPDDTAFDPDNRPDGVTFWDASKGEEYKPHQIEQKNRVDLGEQKTEQKRKVIRDYFFNDMFKLLTSDEEQQREKTAYEVSQMVAERMILFSPIFGRITKEKLNPILYRVFAIMYRNGRFPPLPVGIDPRSIDFDVNYVSKIALAIKAVQNQSLATAVQLITTMVQLDPTVVYLLKCQDATRQVLSNAGVPSGWLRSEAEVQDLAQKQQDEAARLQAAQAAEQGSQAIKNLGPTAQGPAGKTVANQMATGMKAA